MSDKDLQKVLSRFRSKTFMKSDMLPTYGKISNHLQFIQEGLLRVYTIDNQAKEVTLQIGIENAWVNDLYSYFTQKPSENFVEIMQPTSILQIHREDLEILFKDVPTMESFIRLKLQQSYSRLHYRAFNQLNQSAAERYLKFQQKYGHIENRVPQYIIASYLNLSPEHLSKIRSRLSKN